jgi:hypothetical protein
MPHQTWLLLLLVLILLYGLGLLTVRCWNGGPRLPMCRQFPRSVGADVFLDVRKVPPSRSFLTDGLAAFGGDRRRVRP